LCIAAIHCMRQWEEWTNTDSQAVPLFCKHWSKIVGTDPKAV